MLRFLCNHSHWFWVPPPLSTHKGSNWCLPLTHFWPLCNMKLPHLQTKRHQWVGSLQKHKRSMPLLWYLWNPASNGVYTPEKLGVFPFFPHAILAPRNILIVISWQLTLDLFLGEKGEPWSRKPWKSPCNFLFPPPKQNKMLEYSTIFAVETINKQERS